MRAGLLPTFGTVTVVCQITGSNMVPTTPTSTTTPDSIRPRSTTDPSCGPCRRISLAARVARLLRTDVTFGRIATEGVTTAPTGDTTGGIGETGAGPPRMPDA